MEIGELKRGLAMGGDDLSVISTPVRSEKNLDKKNLKRRAPW
jgi:hypothetical protein